MAYKRAHTSCSWNHHNQTKSSRFAPRQFTAQVPQDSHKSPTRKEIEDKAFNQTKLEAFGLPLKKENDTITPTEQKRLHLLQAKMGDFWTQRLEGPSRPVNLHVNSLDKRAPAPLIQRRLIVDSKSLEQQRLYLMINSLFSRNARIRTMEQNKSDIHIYINIVKYEKAQDKYRGFTKYQGENIYIELDQRRVTDEVDLRETLHHELLNHAYKMYLHLENRAGLSWGWKIWDNIFPSYEPSEIIDHLAYISKAVDQIYDYNIIEQWITDKNEDDTPTQAKRAKWMLDYLDTFHKHVLAKKFSIYGKLNATKQGKRVLKFWNIDQNSKSLHRDIEQAVEKDLKARKTEVASLSRNLI